MSTTSRSRKDEKKKPGILRVNLFAEFSATTRDRELKGAITNAAVIVKTNMFSNNKIVAQDVTGQDGWVDIPLESGGYRIEFPSLPDQWQPQSGHLSVTVDDAKFNETGHIVEARQSGLALDILTTAGDDFMPKPSLNITQGKGIWIVVTVPNYLPSVIPDTSINRGFLQKIQKSEHRDNVSYKAQVTDVSGSGPFGFFSRVLLSDDRDGPAVIMNDEAVIEESKQIVGGQVNTTTSLTRTETSFTEDTAFWTAIRNNTDALSFNNYLSFMNWIFCNQLPKNLSGFEDKRFGKKREAFESDEIGLLNKRFLPFTDSDAYRVMKAATEAFVMVNCGVLSEELQPFDLELDKAYLDRRDLPFPQNGLSSAFNDNYLVGVDGNGNVLPYLAVIRRKLPDIKIKLTPFEEAARRSRSNAVDADECFGLLQEKLANPCLLELIWSYWHEEGMLVQTTNAITRRFQNVRSSARDPLVNLEMDPLRPLNNVLWGYIQDEQHRLTVNRRNYEYDHHYGLHLEGKAVQNFRPADTRSKFLEAFHHLLRLCSVFYKQDDDTTIKADAFPVLNALKEIHLILSQGAHNQFGDLPSTARIEMLMQQWLLARPEFRELLPTRIMVAYPEPWMDRVDAMKKLQGWTDTSVLHFRNLGMFGEQLLLSIRWGHWSDEFEPVKALNWARFFRPQAQGYIHAYRAATGVDLSVDLTANVPVDSTLPSVLLQKRLASQQRAM